MTNNNGKLLKMVTWIRDDLKTLRVVNAKGHEKIFEKLDKLEAIQSQHTVKIDGNGKAIKAIKDEKVEDRKEFLQKSGIMVSIIGIIAGTATALVVSLLLP